MNSPIDFINWYYNDDDNFFITLINNKSGATSNYYHNKASYLANMDKIAYGNEMGGKSIYFTINSFKKVVDSELNEYNQVRKTKSNVDSIKSIVFDFDEVETSREDLMNLVKSLGINPTYILETSPKKYQVCYKLNSHNIHFREFELVNKTLAKYFKSDTNVNSVEKVFRLPFFINRKNNHQTRLLKFDPSNIYDFATFEKKLQDYLLDEDLMQFYLELKNKHVSKNPKKKNIIHSSKSSTASKKKTISTSSSVFLPSEVDYKLLAKYQNLLKYNSNDFSIVDIHFIKERAKKVDDYDTVFNEILAIREKLQHPIQRDLQHYYEDRMQFFL